MPPSTVRFRGLGGTVHLSWELVHGRLLLEWREHGGPETAPPDEPGFGLSILRGMIEHDLGGRLDVEFRNEGLFAKIEIPFAQRLPQTTVG